MSQEKKRLIEDRKRKKYWKKWGPYLPERMWGTVREDYGKEQVPWHHFTYEDALSRAYRWGEDGIAGISDTHGRLCFAFSFWNGKDRILKERLFGLSNREGNHGEDVKEYYYFLDNTPTHSYMKYLYKYPQRDYPYEEMRRVNRQRTFEDPEYELIDTGIFRDNRYFDIFIEYAKEGPNDIHIRLTVSNRSNEEGSLHILPVLWFHNPKCDPEKGPLSRIEAEGGVMKAWHFELGTYYLYGKGFADLLFTENRTNRKTIMGEKETGGFVKDGFNDYFVGGNPSAVNPEKKGTKATFSIEASFAPRETKRFYCRLTERKVKEDPFVKSEKIFAKRIREADLFYATIFPQSPGEERLRIGRQALAGMLWNKMHYRFVVRDWLDGDPDHLPPLPPHDVDTARNHGWVHLYADDILSVPDKWEFPQFFSWDSAFHAIPLAMVDMDFAKRQLYILVQEWYMSPSGQLAAYEWNFDHVNPPVHAWATWRVYKIEKKHEGRGDLFFLKRVFNKLLLNFTRWVNRMDGEGRNVFEGGFLGLDNISLFDRNVELPEGGTLYQADATGWMAMFSLNMLTISMELAKRDGTYEDMANKFYNHFLLIADAINFPGHRSFSLWHEEDGFYYDVLRLKGGRDVPLRVRSVVGLIPLFAVMTIEEGDMERLKIFKDKVDWFIKHRPDICGKIACMEEYGENGRRILSILDEGKLRKLLASLLDEEEFLSPYGIRSVSKRHKEHPLCITLEKTQYCIDYRPGESNDRLFGGNSNWRGPVWFPINVLIIESLQRFHHYYGDRLKVEFPSGSGIRMNLKEVAEELASRLIRLFEPDARGERPVFGERSEFSRDEHFKDYIHFFEYFHGETGKGLGSSHQTGWTGFVAKLIQQLH